MNEQEVIAALGMVATFFPHTFTLTGKGQVKVWHQELEPYEANEVLQAVRLLCREKDKFPTLKDILDRLQPMAAGAAEAWVDATRYASEWADGDRWVGGQRLSPPGLPDPAVAAAVESVGGLAAIRARTLDDEPAMRAHFFRRYDEARTKTKRQESLTVIQGGAPRRQMLADATNAIAKPMTGGAQ